MRKTDEENIRAKTFAGKTSAIEKLAFICNTFILTVFLYDQLFGNLNLWYFIVAISLIEIYLLLFCLLPEEYIFLDNELEIRHKIKKTVKISYDSVFNMDADVKDSFVNISVSNKVKLYYYDKNKKKVMLFRPKDTIKFIEAVKEYCPEFHDTPDGKTNIEKII